MITITGPRGANRNHLVVRLADEGVPLAAIGRVMKLPFGDVADTVKHAHLSGQIACRPPSDWPRGQVRYVPGAESVVAPRGNGASSLDEAIEAVPVSLGLTSKETQIIAAMMLRDIATKNYLHGVLYGLMANGGAEPKIVDVFICKIRKKIARFDISIETFWGRGYRLAPEMKARLIELRRAEINASSEALSAAMVRA